MPNEVPLHQKLKDYYLVNSSSINNNQRLERERESQRDREEKIAKSL